MSTHELARLSETQLAEIARLARVCNEDEGLDIKLNWNILRGHLRISVTSFLQYENEQLVGFLALYQFNADEAEISGMVHPQFRRKHIFSQLVQRVMVASHKAGLGRILFIVDHHSSSGKAYVGALQAQQIEMYEYKMTLATPILPSGFEKDLVFRQTYPDEVPVLQHLMVKAFDISEEHAAELYMADNLAESNARYYLALFNATCIGKIDVSLGEHEALIYNLGISPEYRGRGFGRQMLARTIQDLLATGQQRITLEVEAANENALRLYTSCGFTPSNRYDYHALDIPVNLHEHP
jgi:ribosomal protein S18 acetylase RimI-like enzyme